MNIERPPEIWEAVTEDVTFIPLLGEMIAAALAGGMAEGLPLADLTLNVSNVVVEPSPDDEGEPTWVEPGDYVAVTVSGATDLGPDSVWRPGAPPGAAEILGRLDQPLLTAGGRFAYVRRLPARASITVFLARRP
jgi:hypothetical protein